MIFAAIKRKLEKRKLRRTRQTFGHEIKNFSLPGYPQIEYAQWLNPFAYKMEFEESQLSFLRQFIRSGDFVVDIGANTGDSTLPMALLAGTEGKVLALEPNPRTFEVLQVNASLNPELVSIDPLQAAATEADGDFHYRSSEATFNNGGISRDDNKTHGKYSLEQKVRGVNLQDYLRSNYQELLPRLAYIKVDTEGYDKDILETLAELLDEFRPCVQFECFKRMPKADRYELFELFASKGYELFHFDDKMLDVAGEGQPLSREDMTRWKHFDVCAIHPSKQNELGKSVAA